MCRSLYYDVSLGFVFHRMLLSTSFGKGNSSSVSSDSVVSAPFIVLVVAPKHDDVDFVVSGAVIIDFKVNMVFWGLAVMMVWRRCLRLLPSGKRMTIHTPSLKVVK